MIDLSNNTNQVSYVSSFDDLVTKPFYGAMNAVCWSRNLVGDFSEIVNKIELQDNLKTIELEELLNLQLSAQGQLAREILMNDFLLLKNHGASPTLNLINYYERDDALSFFPTDVYSFHVDRSPIATDTFLCTYFGETSELLPNSEATQKILMPEIRDELRQMFRGNEKSFEDFLKENFFDLHYSANPDARIVKLGVGKLWRLAVDHPENKALPCIHRAPKEKMGEARLLMIC